MRNLTFCLCLLLLSTFLSAQQYDLVLEGGRVMDPETGLDAVRNVGIRDGKIARISAEPLAGKACYPGRWPRRCPRLHRPAPTWAGPRQPARQGVRRCDDGVGNGNWSARRHPVSKGQRRALTHPLRHHCQSRRCPRPGFWRAFAGRNHSAQERTSDRPARHPRTDQADSATPALGT